MKMIFDVPEGTMKGFLKYVYVDSEKKIHVEKQEFKNAKLCCGECIEGQPVRLLGNGIDEPPYIFKIKCPYDKKYYHDPEEACMRDTLRHEEVHR